MEWYRCYFLGATDRIRAAEEIEAASLGAAIEQGLTMLRSRPQHRAVEIWQGSRMLYPGPAAPQPDEVRLPG